MPKEEITILALLATDYLDIKMKDVPFTFQSDTLPGLAKFVEEAGEALQIAAKLMATGGEGNYWGRDKDLYESFEEELADLQACIHFLVTDTLEDKIDIDRHDARIDEKLTKFFTWHYRGEEDR